LKDTGPGFKNFGTGAESESEKVSPATSGAGKLLVAFWECLFCRQNANSLA